MTLVDTSAWVEYLRSTDSATHQALRRIIADGGPLHTTDVVVMEVLAGARDDAHTAVLRRLLGRCEHLATEGLADFEIAASLYRVCRRNGDTPRALTDCLVGAVALRHDVEILHCDRDFAALARHSELRCRTG